MVWGAGVWNLDLSIMVRGLGFKAWDLGFRRLDFMFWGSAHKPSAFLYGLNITSIPRTYETLNEDPDSS